MANPIWDKPETVRAWRANRGRKIGSSDIAPILGLSPWQTALGIYMQKVEALERAENDEPEDEPISIDDLKCRGHLYEPLISRAYELKYDVKLKEIPSRTMPGAPFAFASVDRITEDERHIVELKKVQRWAAGGWGRPESDDAPDYYIVQVQWQMHVCGKLTADIFALIGDDTFARYPIEYSPAVGEMLMDSVAAFWKQIENREPPSPDFDHPATYDLCKKLKKAQSGVTFDLEADVLPFAVAFNEAKEKIKELNKQKDALEARLHFAMGEAQFGIVNGWEVERRPGRRETIDTKAAKEMKCPTKVSEFHTIYVNGPKEKDNASD